MQYGVNRLDRFEQYIFCRNRWCAKRNVNRLHYSAIRDISIFSSHHNSDSFLSLVATNHQSPAIASAIFTRIRKTHLISTTCPSTRQQSPKKRSIWPTRTHEPKKDQKHHYRSPTRKPSVLGIRASSQMVDATRGCAYWARSVACFVRSDG